MLRGLCAVFSPSEWVLTAQKGSLVVLAYDAALNVACWKCLFAIGMGFLDRGGGLVVVVVVVVLGVPSVEGHPKNQLPLLSRTALDDDKMLS